MRWVVCVAVLVACGKSSSTVESPPMEREPDPPEIVAVDEDPMPAVPTAIELQALAATDDEMYACETAADCQVTCLREGSCCGQLCQCTNVYTTGYVHKLQEQRDASCEGAICPIASCMAPTEEAVAVCVDNRCAVEMKPRVGVPNRSIELE